MGNDAARFNKVLDIAFFNGFFKDRIRCRHDNDTNMFGNFFAF